MRTKVLKKRVERRGEFDDFNLLFILWAFLIWGFIATNASFIHVHRRMSVESLATRKVTPHQFVLIAQDGHPVEQSGNANQVENSGGQQDINGNI
jgi:hypothetical protein